MESRRPAGISSSFRTQTWNTTPPTIRFAGTFTRRQSRCGLRFPFSRQRPASRALFLAFSGQLGPHFGLQLPDQYQPLRHGDLLQSLPAGDHPSHSSRRRPLRIEPEITVKVAKRKLRIYEVGISYAGRTYEEGKKIGWKDGVWALWCLLKY